MSKNRVLKFERNPSHGTAPLYDLSASLFTFPSIPYSFILFLPFVFSFIRTPVAPVLPASLFVGYFSKFEIVLGVVSRVFHASVLRSASEHFADTQSVSNICIVPFVEGSKEDLKESLVIDNFPFDRWISVFTVAIEGNTRILLLSFKISRDLTLRYQETA